MRASRILSTLAVAASVACAAPLSTRNATMTRTELEDGDAGSCPSVILIFARGSGEEGNMGDGPGPALASALEAAYESIWVQGVGGDYKAEYAPNALIDGTNQESIDEGKRLFKMANEKCPDAAVATGGYSQGAALVAAALTELAGSEVQDQVAGAVLFGYTQNKQNDGKIPDYPADRTRVYCADGDVLCDAILIIKDEHHSYNDEAAEEAPAFLQSVIG